MATYDRAKATQRIFDAAVEEFAAHGIGGARVDRIAANAGSNKAQLYNYFGNKEQLFAAVLKSRFMDLNNSFVMKPERIVDFVTDIFDFLTANPDVVRLLLQETFQLTSVGEGPYRIKRDAEFETEAAAVRSAQEAGLVNPSLDPAFVIFTMMSLVCWYVAVPQIGELMAPGLPTHELRARYREHIVFVTKQMLNPR